jgi:hypothetical protein
MAIVVKENWSGQRLNLKWPWTASREFTVTGTTDPVTALEATGLPLRNDGHPANPARLICEGVEIKDVPGPSFFVITANYSCPESGKFDDGNEDDPLQEPARISWTKMDVTELVDRDVNGRAILNSNGSPADPMPLPCTMRQLIITKNFPYFDIVLADTYENAVNSTAINLSGVVTVAEQHMRCACIAPATEYEAGALFVPMRFVFEIYTTDVLGNYPFQYRQMDGGTEGWYSDTSTNPATKRKAKFSNGKGELLSDVVRLDGTGKPLTLMFSAVKVGESNATPVTPPAAVQAYAREYYTADGTAQGSANASTAAVFNIWKRARIVDMTPLLELL